MEPCKSRMSSMGSNIKSLIFIFVVYIISLGKSFAFADFSVTPVADLSSKANEEWITTLANPKRPSELWAFNKKGQLHVLSSGTFDTRKVLELNENIKNLYHFESIALHPNFLQTSQPGYLAFYTTHIEANSNHRARRAYSESDRDFDFDIVLMEWKLATPTSFSLDQAGREILRLAAPTPNAISYLGFNDQHKPWHESFGLLHFLIKGQENLHQHPLYSGSLHRLNPLPFGLKQYTVPKDNPFITDPSLAKSTLTTGLGEAVNIHWSKDFETSALLEIAVKDKLNQSKVKFTVDYRKSEAKIDALNSQSLGIRSNSVMYRGGFLKQQRNALLYLNKNKHWQLTSLSAEPGATPDILWVIDDSLISDSNSLSLQYLLRTDQLLIIDNDNKTITELQLKTSGVEKAPVHSPQESTNNNLIYVLLGLLVAVFGYYFTTRRSKLESIKKMLHKQFAKFQLSSDGTSLSLYQRHQDTASNVIPVSEIVAAHLYLDNHECKYFDVTNKIGMRNQDEKDLRRTFADIKRHKMTDDRTREVHLSLVTAKEVYKGCIYLRKGNQRLTKAKYEEILEQSIDLIWHLSAKNLSSLTEKREHVSTVKENSVARKLSSPSIKKPVIKANPVKSNSEVESKPKEAVEATSVKQDHDIVDALDKLAQMKQKGLLTEQEFAEAKAKLLNKIV